MKCGSNIRMKCVVTWLQVCGRLGLVSLAYMWRQPQARLLRDMWQAGIVAVMVKVAAIGQAPSTLNSTQHIHVARPCRVIKFVTFSMSMCVGFILARQGAQRLAHAAPERSLFLLQG